jgi:hypothetical protein
MNVHSSVTHQDGAGANYITPVAECQAFSRNNELLKSQQYLVQINEKMLALFARTAIIFT